MWVAIETYSQPGYNEVVASEDTYDAAVKAVESIVPTRHESSDGWAWGRNDPKPTFYWREDGGSDPMAIILYEVRGG